MYESLNSSESEVSASDSIGSTGSFLITEEYQTIQIDKETFELPKRYKLLEWMGQGAYGVVYSAEDSTMANVKLAIKKNKNIYPRKRKLPNPDVSSNGAGSSARRSLFGWTTGTDGKVDKAQVLGQECGGTITAQKRILREVKILIHLRNHPNIIHLHDIILPKSYDSFGDVYYVTDLMETDLKCVLNSEQELTDKHIQWLMYQLLLGVYYYQSANVLHRDLKPENILLNSDCQLKICDFGLARRLEEVDPRMSTNYVQTRWYRAPELLLGNSEGNKQTDMWSVGCIMAEMMGRKVLFSGTSTLDQLRRIIYVLGTPSDTHEIAGSMEAYRFVMSLPKSIPIRFEELFKNANPLAIDLLKRILVFNPANRLSAEEALRHPYFENIFRESDLRTCEREFDFKLDDAAAHDSDTLKRMAYETIIEFRKIKRSEARSKRKTSVPKADRKSVV